MVTLFKKSRIGLVALGAMALMAIAGWQFGSNGTQEEFSGKEVAMENAIAGSGCFKVTWAQCPGSFQQVIRCRPSGEGCCSSSWQEHCS
jgi:hypothetical protein